MIVGWSRESCGGRIWTEGEKKYRLKMHLDRTAFQTFCMLPNETKDKYSAVVDALHKRFQPVDTDEGLLTQNDESGVTLAMKAFPSLLGKVIKTEILSEPVN